MAGLAADAMPYLAELQRLLQASVGRPVTQEIMLELNAVAQAFGRGVIFDGTMLIVEKRLYSYPSPWIAERDIGSPVLGHIYGDHSDYAATEIRRDLAADMQREHRSAVSVAAHELRMLIQRAPADALPDVMRLATENLAHDLPYDLIEATAVQWMEIADRMRKAVDTGS